MLFNVCVARVSDHPPQAQAQAQGPVPGLQPPLCPPESTYKAGCGETIVRQLPHFSAPNPQQPVPSVPPPREAPRLFQSSGLTGEAVCSGKIKMYIAEVSQLSLPKFSRLLTPPPGGSRIQGSPYFPPCPPSRLIPSFSPLDPPGLRGGVMVLSSLGGRYHLPDPTGPIP